MADLGLEWRSLPELQGIWRLNVIMPVNEACLPARLAIISSQTARITASGMYLCIEACLFEALYEPIRTRFHVGLELFISRYGRKPKKLDQTIYVVSHCSFLFAE